ncbi:hypothetical protein EJ06DRAFT_207552 [Trichodelitschia bisporula]|uniref:Uncharacterized protein n=1 Tax=Trichodelitschia bisporula TaxID=703511 RepID=A0A6G1I8S3_9PEZI|nr:hypothetical protein EJ06DRAFT_207552 [Trichodelitschia bisporula]
MSFPSSYYYEEMVSDCETYDGERLHRVNAHDGTDHLTNGTSGALRPLTNGVNGTPHTETTSISEARTEANRSNVPSTASRDSSSDVISPLTMPIAADILNNLNYLSNLDYLILLHTLNQRFEFPEASSGDKSDSVSNEEEPEDNGVYHHAVNGADHHGVNGVDHHGVNGVNHHGINGVNHHGVNGVNHHGVNGVNHHGVNGVHRHGVNGVNYHGVNSANHHVVNGADHHGVNGLDTNLVNGVDAYGTFGSRISSPGTDTFLPTTNPFEFRGFSFNSPNEPRSFFGFLVAIYTDAREDLEQRWEHEIAVLIDELQGTAGEDRAQRLERPLRGLIAQYMEVLTFLLEDMDSYDPRLRAVIGRRMERREWGESADEGEYDDSEYGLGGEEPDEEERGGWTE